MADFSIRVFDTLADLGFPRLANPADFAPGKRRAIESFPTSAWRSLKLRPLPGKANASSEHVRRALETLMERVPITLCAMPTHDEVQALIAGLAASPLYGCATLGNFLCGQAPAYLESAWREGFTVNPQERSD
jgi:hypothetical protein